MVLSAVANPLEELQRLRAESNSITNQLNTLKEYITEQMDGSNMYQFGDYIAIMESSKRTALNQQFVKLNHPQEKCPEYYKTSEVDIIRVAKIGQKTQEQPEIEYDPETLGDEC